MSEYPRTHSDIQCDECQEYFTLDGDLTSRIDRRIRRKVTAAASAPVRDAIRAELDQSPEWWDRQFRALVRKQIPRDAASHEGHSIAEAHAYGGAVLYRTCVDCNVGINPHEEKQ